MGSKGLSYNAPYDDLPTPTRTGYTFDGWYTSATGGTRVSSLTTIQCDTTVFAQWLYTLTFNANGGIVSPQTKVLPYNSAYGELPSQYSTCCPLYYPYIFIPSFSISSSSLSLFLSCSLFKTSTFFFSFSLSASTRL